MERRPGRSLGRIADRVGSAEVVSHRTRRAPTGRSRGGHRLGLGRIERRRLIQEEISLRRIPGGCDGRGPSGEVEVHENGLDGGRLGEERDDPHLAAAARAEQGKHPVIVVAVDAGRGDELRRRTVWPSGVGFGSR